MDNDALAICASMTPTYISILSQDMCTVSKYTHLFVCLASERALRECVNCILMEARLTAFGSLLVYFAFARCSALRFNRPGRT
jgi:hypothetical protein